MAVIQWYPGHMNKAKNQLIERLDLVDAVIEVLDARVPMSSRNPVIEKITANKPKVIVLNKSDLADPNLTKQWIDALSDDHSIAIALDSKHTNNLSVLFEAIKKVTSARTERLKAKGVKEPIIRVVCAGIPNSGKSTLINRMVGKNIAVTGNRPGVTKNQNWLKTKQNIELLDTPGILWPKFEDQSVGKKLAAIGSIKDTVFHADDVALFILQYLKENYNKVFSTITKGLDSNMELPDLMLELTKKAGLKDDYEKFSSMFLRDLTNLKYGRITFDQVRNDNN